MNKVNGNIYTSKMKIIIHQYVALYNELIIIICNTFRLILTLSASCPGLFNHLCNIRKISVSMDSVPKNFILNLEPT